MGGGGSFFTDKEETGYIQDECQGIKAREESMYCPFDAEKVEILCCRLAKNVLMLYCGT